MPTFCMPFSLLLCSFLSIFPMSLAPPNKIQKKLNKTKKKVPVFSMLIGAPFMKGGPTPPGTTSGKATSSGASAQGAATSSARFHPY